ncbi:P-type conjugative transfer protein TrbG [Sphingomonas sp. FW199]|uniref:P-type conjugative transfer protein TrbG n=1 Tax=Sphingomonas sp. FW199 TaxID=3400217 RepID=UPI003CF39585
MILLVAAFSLAVATKGATGQGQPSAQLADQAVVRAASREALVGPASEDWQNAVQVYGWHEGAVYRLYATPGRITDIMLEPGEKLVGTGPVAAGDTLRWMIGDTVSGTGPSMRVHILVKPTRADIATNLIIHTDRRSYHLELTATKATHMPAIAWRYPAPLPSAPVMDEASDGGQRAVDTERLSFAYRISGDRPDWRPVLVFDDGRRTFIAFDADIEAHSLPPLFVRGPRNTSELVNYRVDGRFIIVDRLLDKAELRLGDKRSEARVRIDRHDAKARP